jgi:hypothetical protein
MSHKHRYPRLSLLSSLKPGRKKSSSSTSLSHTVQQSLIEEQLLLAMISPDAFIMFSDATISDSDFDKMVYLTYRDIFKDKLAKLRKRSKDHLHHKQLANAIDLEKTCRILRDLLAARLFESESVAKATFPTLFSPGELGNLVNDTTLIVKCVEDGFEGECEQRDRTNPDAPLSWISSILPILLCQMALPQRVPQLLDSIALTESRSASESLLEPRQNPRGPYFKWERERRLCPRKSSAKV